MVNPALPKQTAIEIAYYAYRRATVKNSSNAIEGLWGTGLYAFSVIQIHKRIGEH